MRPVGGVVATASTAWYRRVRTPSIRPNAKPPSPSASSHSDAGVIMMQLQSTWTNFLRDRAAPGLLAVPQYVAIDGAKRDRPDVVRDAKATRPQEMPEFAGELERAARDQTTAGRSVLCLTLRAPCQTARRGPSTVGEWSWLDSQIPVRMGCRSKDPIGDRNAGVASVGNDELAAQGRPRVGGHED